MRQTRPFAIAAAGLFAIVFYYLTWTAYPSCSWCKVNYQGLWLLTFLSFAPLLVFAWSLIAYRRSASFVWIRRAIMTHAAVCAALVGLLWFGISPIHAVLAALSLLADGCVLALLPPRAASERAIDFYPRTVAFAAGGTILAMVVWSLMNIALVAGYAAKLAQGRPYCIQVASSGLGRYAEVTSLHALSGLRMQTPYTNAGGSSDFQFAFHAVLVISNNGVLEYRNWSYRKGVFVLVPERTLRALYLLRPSCQPRPGFVRQLSWL
ncbi:MAG TPA: hypothetical protein VH913_10135 [Hyphomicrobiaceae bacterium]|jgi:hypothetical protein